MRRGRILIDNKIKTLLTLVNVGSYTKAARHLALTQPAVSHHIKLLEQEYGIMIFYSDKKKLIPTPEGEILIKYSRRAIALEENAIKAIEDNRKQVKSLVIGITPTAEENLVPYVFASYCNEHPKIHINIVTNTINNIYDMLKAYELDLAIIEGRITDDRFTSILLDTDYLCLAVSPKHKFAKRKSVNLLELKKENFILRQPNAGTRKLFENHLISHSENINNFNVIMELDNVSLIKDLVSSNLGITVISHKSCRDEIAAGKLVVVPIENLIMTREINMIYPKDFHHKDILDDIRMAYNLKN